MRCAIVPAEGDGTAKSTPVACEWNALSSTALFSFANVAGKTVITGEFCDC